MDNMIAPSRMLAERFQPVNKSVLEMSNVGPGSYQIKSMFENKSVERPNNRMTMKTLVKFPPAVVK